MSNSDNEFSSTDSDEKNIFKIIRSKRLLVKEMLIKKKKQMVE